MDSQTRQLWKLSELMWGGNSAPPLREPLDGFRDCMDKTSSLLQKAKVATYGPRYQRLLSDIEYASRHLQYIVDDINVRINEYQSIVASAPSRDFQTRGFRSLLSLYRGKEIELETKEGKVLFIHKRWPSVIIPCRDGEVDMGEVRLILRPGPIQLGVNTPSIWIKTSYKSRRTGYYHPHVYSDGSVCWGSYKRIVLGHLARGDYREFLDSVEAYLYAINQNSQYEDLSNWPTYRVKYGGNCYICGAPIPEKQIAECGICGRIMCTLCSKSCAICKKPLGVCKLCVCSNVICPKEVQIAKPICSCSSCMDNYGNEVARKYQAVIGHPPVVSIEKALEELNRLVL